MTAIAGLYVNGRVVPRANVPLWIASSVVFIVDLLSRPSLAVSVAYCGVVVFALRALIVRHAVQHAAWASFLTLAALALEGRLRGGLSDALVTGLLTIASLWMIVLLGADREAMIRRSEARAARTRPSAAIDQESIDSHADIVRLTEVQRALLDRLSLAAQTAGLAIWDRDFVTGNTYLDDSFAKVFGLRTTARTVDDAVGVIHAEDLSRVTRSWGAALNDAEGPSIVSERFRIVRQTDGALRHVQACQRVFRGEDGRPERSIGIAWDVTEEVLAAQALMDATEAARAADRAKSALLANVSHEIRTPMNGVLGMTDLLLDSDLDATQRDYAATIRNSADSLLRVIDDLLDFSRIEAGRMPIESVPTDLPRMLEEVRALMAVQAQRKQLAFQVQIDPEVPRRVMTDPQRVRQCLVNLVGNAVKFTPSGSVTVRVTRAAPPNASMMRFEVSDTGVGIEPDALSRLFEPFVQADASTTREFGGTGLGLSIVKRIVEMMDGRVGVSSRRGHGSIFWFELPMAQVQGVEEHELSESGRAHDARASRREPQLGGALERAFEGHVLVVEDNVVNQKVARQILERLGCTVTIADHGAHALALFAAARFDLVLMDLQMPIMDGLTAARAMRQRESVTRTPIVALTANAMGGEYERCMAAGMDGFLGKPLDLPRLREYLTSFGLRRPDASHSAAAPAQRAPDEDSSATSEAGGAPVDLARFNALTGGDVPFAVELLEAFVASSAQLLEELEHAVAAGDVQQVARSAHRLKGAAASIHAVPLAQAAAQLEQEAAVADRAVMAAGVARLRSLVAQATQYLQDAHPRHAA